MFKQINTHIFSMFVILSTSNAFAESEITCEGPYSEKTVFHVDNEKGLK